MSARSASNASPTRISVVGFLVPEAGQAEDRVHRRVPGADHHHAATGEAFPLGAEHVGDAVADAGRRGPFADVPETPLAPAGFGSIPRARRVDDARARCRVSLPVGSDGDDLERSRLRALSTAHGPCPDASRRRREHRVADAGRSPDAPPAERDSGRSVRGRWDHGRVRASTSRSSSSSCRAAVVDDVSPRREERDMAPLGDRRRQAPVPARTPRTAWPRTARCAAAARPTGPAPMIATGRESVV